MHKTVWIKPLNKRLKLGRTDYTTLCKALKAKHYESGLSASECEFLNREGSYAKVFTSIQQQLREDKPKLVEWVESQRS